MSFLLFGKHIQISGLLDSGNSLYDTKTGKAVIIVSLTALKKFINSDDYEKLRNNINHEKTINYLDCSTIGEKKVTIPIFDVGEVKLESIEDGNLYTVKCVVGITKEEFLEKNDYECLLHREFI